MAAVAKRQLLSCAPRRQAHELVPHADPKDGLDVPSLKGDHLLHLLDRRHTHGRVSGAIGQEDAVVLVEFRAENSRIEQDRTSTTRGRSRQERFAGVGHDIEIAYIMRQTRGDHRRKGLTRVPERKGGKGGSWWSQGCSQAKAILLKAKVSILSTKYKTTA